jgi:hypothetical protein
MDKVSFPGSFEAQRVVVYKEDPLSKENILLKEIRLT